LSPNPLPTFQKLSDDNLQEAEVHVLPGRAVAVAVKTSCKEEL